ncbi:Bacterial SH3 domain protein [anaerobic digester metagenome]
MKQRIRPEKPMSQFDGTAVPANRRNFMRLMAGSALILFMPLVLTSCLQLSSPKITQTLTVPQTMALPVTKPVQTTPATTPAAPSTSLVGIVVNGDQVNVRSQATTQSDTVGTVSAGQEVPVLDEFYNDSWHRIDYEGKSAFIHKDFLTVRKVTVENPATPEPSPIYVGIVTGERVNIRKQASANGELVGTAETDQEFKLLEREPDGKWFKIEFNGSPAYISADFLQVKEVPAEQPSVPPVDQTIYGIVTGDSINIRQEPSLTAPIAGSAKKNDRLVVLEQNIDDAWHKVEFNDGEAYVYAQYLTIEEPVTPPSIPEPSSPQPPTGPEPAPKNTGLIINAAKVNVRFEPSISAMVLGQLNQSDQVTIVKAYFNENWHQIEFDGKTAYIHSYYVELGN